MADLVMLQKIRREMAGKMSPDQEARLNQAILEAQRAASHPSMAQAQVDNRPGAPGREERLLQLANDPSIRNDPAKLSRVHAALKAENENNRRIAIQKELGPDAMGKEIGDRFGIKNQQVRNIAGEAASALAAFGQSAKQTLYNASNALGMRDDQSVKDELEITEPLRLGNPLAADLGALSIAAPPAVALNQVAALPKAVDVATTLGRGAVRGGSALLDTAFGAGQGYAFSDPDSRGMNALIGGGTAALVAPFTNVRAANFASGRRQAADELYAKIYQLTPDDITQLIQKHGSLAGAGAKMRALGGTNLGRSGVDMGARAGELEAIANRAGVDLGQIVQEVAAEGGRVDSARLVGRLRDAHAARFPGDVVGMSPEEYAKASEKGKAAVDRIEETVRPRMNLPPDTQSELGFPSSQTQTIRGERVQPGPRVPVAQGSPPGTTARGAMVDDEAARVASTVDAPEILGDRPGQRILFEQTGDVGARGPVRVPANEVPTAETYVPNKAEAPTAPTQRRLEGTNRPNPDFQLPEGAQGMTQDELDILGQQLGDIADTQQAASAARGARGRVINPDENLQGLLFEQQPPQVVPTVETTTQGGMNMGYQRPGDAGYQGYQNVTTIPERVGLLGAEIPYTTPGIDVLSRAKTNTGNTLMNAAGQRPTGAATLKYDPDYAFNKDILGALIDEQEQVVRAKSASGGSTNWADSLRNMIETGEEMTLSPTEVAPRVARFLREKDKFGLASDFGDIARRAEARNLGVPVAEGGGTPRSTFWRNIYNKHLQPQIVPRLAAVNDWLGGSTIPPTTLAGRAASVFSPAQAKNWLPTEAGNDAITSYLIQRLRMNDESGAYAESK